jgi:hypothetical protein
MLSVVKRSPVPSLSLSAGRRPCDYDCGSLLINKWLQCKHRLPVQCSATRLLSKRWVFFLELWISRLRPCFPRVHLVRFSFAIVFWFGGCRIWANAALLRSGPVNGSRTIYISSSKQFLCTTYKTEQFHLASLSPKSRSRLWLLRSMESVTDALWPWPTLARKLRALLYFRCLFFFSFLFEHHIILPLFDIGTQKKCNCLPFLLNLNSYTNSLFELIRGRPIRPRQFCTNSQRIHQRYVRWQLTVSVQHFSSKN